MLSKTPLQALRLFWDLHRFSGDEPLRLLDTRKDLGLGA